MSRYPRERIEVRLQSLALASAHRIFGLSQIEEPVKIHSSPSRFCDGVSGYAVLYAAVSFETCVIETLVRDRFARRSQRDLPLTAILVRAWTHIVTRPECVRTRWIFVDPAVWKSGHPRTPPTRDIWQPVRRWSAR